MKKSIFLIIILALLLGCSGNDISNTLFGYVNPGDPELGTPSGYAGSQVCKECHFEKYESWRGTLHNLSLRNPDQRGLAGKGIVADSNENGLIDFAEDLNLGTYEKSTGFHVYGANAPILNYDSSSGANIIKIGGVDFSVDRTYGGNGFYSQIYLTKIDRSYYVLPVQYNEASMTYSVFKGSNWYDDLNQPIYDTTDKTPVTIGRAYDSFERMCSGCHGSGIFIQFDEDTGEYLTGYIELNTGCESCHNGGENHRDLGGGRGVGGIFNPKNLLDGTQSGLKRANEICGRCHIRGQSVAAIGNDPLFNYLEFPAKNDNSGNALLFTPGDTLSDYINPSANSDDYWGYDSSDGSFITSLSNYQQLPDINAGAHSPESGADPALLPTCFTCHNPHGTENRANIVTTITIDGVTIDTKVNDNTLCLACHAGDAPFENITKTDVADILISSSYDVIRGEVSKHTKHPYAPEDFQTGRCTRCHMVKTAKSAGEYDITSHTFNVISPHLSNDMYSSGTTPIPNSCEGCHDDTNDFAITKYDAFTGFTDETATIPDSHDQNSEWRNTYHMLYSSIKGDSECKACHYINNEIILPQANPGCTTYCHGI